MRKRRQGAWEYIKSPLRTVQRSEMQSFPAGEGLWPRRKWCYMLVKQLQHHTAFLVSKLLLLTLFFLMPSKRRSSEIKSKEKHHTHTYKLKEKKELCPAYVTCKTLTNLSATVAPLRPLCLITHTAANQNPAVCGVSQTGCQSVDWRISLLLNPIQRAYYHGNAEHLCVPVGNLWNHILKPPARKTSASQTVTCELLLSNISARRILSPGRLLTPF